MQLPVEQYYELDPEMIRPLGGRVFALTVPRTEVHCKCLLSQGLQRPALPRHQRTDGPDAPPLLALAAVSVSLPLPL